MDKFFIRGLKINAIIGVKPDERETPQPIVLDLELGVDMRAAAHSDELKHTIDYDEIIVRLREFIGASQFFLVEKLADEVAQLLLKEFSIPWLRLQLHKPDVLAETESVGVIIERTL